MNMMSLIKHTITHAAQVDLEYDQLTDLQKRDVLDDQFVFFANLLDMVERLSITFEASKSDWCPLLQMAKQNLQKQQEKILKFYEDFFPDGKTIGDFTDQETPDIFVVLGSANPDIANQRSEHASTLAKRYKNGSIIVSGGGYNVEETEAKRMHDTLISKGIHSDQIIMEADSMDTIGNAFFTKLTLKKRHLLKTGLKILIVTSKFHASRSLNYFRRIFSSQYKIAVNCIVTLDEQARIQAARHELLTEYRAQNSVFVFDTGDYIRNKATNFQELPLRELGAYSLMSHGFVGRSLDDQTLLCQLLDKHDLYKSRFDLWRKYFDVCAQSSAEDEAQQEFSINSAIAADSEYAFLSSKDLIL